MTYANPRYVIEKRREVIATLLARGLTQVEILEQMSKEHRQLPDGSIKKNPMYLPNPKTGEPYDKSTISRDVKAIRLEWKKVRERSVEQWLDQEVAVLLEARRLAWGQRDYVEVRQNVLAMAKVLGLNEPQRFEHRFDDNQLEQIQSHRLNLLEDIERMAERLQTEEPPADEQFADEV
jgi:hypothetical protein